MAPFYFDTSALVKQYARETGSTWIRNLTNIQAGNTIYTVRLAGPELIAALFRKVRMGEISLNTAVRTATTFKTNWQSWYHILEVSISTVDRAMALAEKHGLRGYDAVHLAAALELQEVRSTMQVPPFVFISADNDQLLAAQAEGLPTENPNSYP